MKKFWLLLCLFLTLAACHLSGNSSNSFYQVTDWTIDNTFTDGVEGPAVDKSGNLFAVNLQKQGTIGIISGKNLSQIYVQLPQNSVGNGIRFDQQGNMYIADYVNHNVLRIDVNDEQNLVKVFAHNSQMNQPNDLAITSNGTLFASDPNWSQNSGNLWMISGKGETTLIESNMGTTNGVEISPNDQFLYVNESVQRKIWRYDLKEGQKPENKTLFYQFNDHGLDGMRCDEEGNLYVARYGAGEIAIISPQGLLLNSVKLKGQFPTNLAFGGEDGKTVFVTMQKRGAIETFTVPIAGRAHSMWKK